MADVTISQLTQGTPNNAALLPYSQGGNTLCVAPSAILQNTGNVGIGTSSPTAKLHISQSVASTSLVIEGIENPIEAYRYTNNADGSVIFLAKSRNDTVGSHTIVQNGDQVGELKARGSNGTIFRDAASIGFFIDGTPGAGTDMPGRIVFNTSPDGSSGVKERMRINSNGYVTMPFQPAFHVWNQVNQTLTNNTVMQFDAATSNSARVFNQGGHYANGKFTAPVAGLYQFSVNVVMNTSSGGDARYIGFVLNGTDLLDYAYVRAGQTYQSFNVSATIKLAATNYIEVRAFGADATMNMDNSGTFSGHLIG